ncbi:MAG TPA: DMT family transporter [Gemmatimonadales bacterium]|nr:DMT family transporter [Gemmatimonadales bacterium]
MTESRAARLAAFAAVVLWGVSFVATKAALREVSPVTLIFTRFALGVAVLFLLLTLRRQPLIPPRDAWPMLALIGFVGIFVHQMIQAHALTLTTAVQTGWLIGLTPIWSAVLAAIFLGEGFGRRKVLGLALGTVGTLVLITRGDLSFGVLALPATKGDLLILASTVNWAIYTILGRDTLKRLGSARATAGAMFFGWAMLIPFFLRSAGWHEFRGLSSSSVIAILFLGIGCSGLGYLLWYAALERIEASQVAAFLYLEPLVTLVAAVALLGESVAVSTILGGVLVLVGVLIVQTEK